MANIYKGLEHRWSGFWYLRGVPEPIPRGYQGTIVLTYHWAGSYMGNSR